MITLNSIRIRNFRAIKELTFQPKKDGITGIFGPNGAGKTSILTAVMFALYGVRPKDVTVAGLRRIGSGDEECSVSVVFTHLGQTIEVIREIKGAEGGTGKPVANIYADGSNVSKTSVTAADKWVHRRLGVTAEGFMTAFVVRQKELDAFVRAVPSERKAIIEKLAGVDTINKALIAARSDEKESRKTLDLLPGSQEQLDSAGADVDFWSNRADEAKVELETLDVTLTALQEERDVVFKKIEKFREHQSALQRVQGQRTALDNEIPNLDRQLDRVSYVTEMSDSDDIASLREQYKGFTAELNELRGQEASLQHSIQQYTNRKNQLESLVADEQQRVIRLEEAITTDSTTLDTEHESITSRISDIDRRVVQLSSQNSDLHESLEALHDSSDCPTCKTHLDNPDALREQFKAIIATNTETIQDLSNERERLISRMQEIVRMRTQVDELAALKNDLVKNEEELKAVQESSSGAGPQIETLQATIEQKSQEQQKVQELGAKARSLNDDRVERARLIERKEVALLDLERLRREEQELSQVFSEKDLNDAQRALEQTRLSYEKTTQSHSQLTAAVTEANVRFNTARSSYQRAYDQWDRKKALQEAHAAKSLTTDMLDQFRQATVASIAPELSDYATSLISDMTNGDFTEIKLDEEFKASLVDANGVERPVSWLSGGEESAVALALRLSVAFLITGGNPEVLWLDEPLTAQDKDRRSAILSMIRKLPINQILLINHAQEAQDIVDYEVTLTKGD